MGTCVSYFPHQTTHAAILGQQQHKQRTATRTTKLSKKEKGSPTLNKKAERLQNNPTTEAEAATRAAIKEQDELELLIAYKWGQQELQDTKRRQWVATRTTKLSKKEKGSPTLNKKAERLQNNPTTEAVAATRAGIELARRMGQRELQDTTQTAPASSFIIKKREESMRDNPEHCYETSNDKAIRAGIELARRRLSKLQSNERFLKAARNNKKIVMAAVRRHGSELEFATPQLQNDKDIVPAAVRQDINALQWATSGIQEDKDAKALECRYKKTLAKTLSAVRQNGFALENVSPRLRNDRQIVLAAVQKNGGALEYATSSEHRRFQFFDVIPRHPMRGTTIFIPQGSFNNQNQGGLFFPLL